MDKACLYDLLFDSLAEPNASRVPITQDNCRLLGDSAHEARNALQNAIEVITTLAALARSRQRPSAGVETYVTQTIGELQEFARALDEFESRAEEVASADTRRQ